MKNQRVFDFQHYLTLRLIFTKSFQPKPCNSWSPKKIPIYISNKSKWSYTNLMIFLNELNDFITFDHSYVKRTTNQKITKAYFHYRHYDVQKNWHVYITVSLDDIKVKVSTNFLRDLWNPESQILESNIGAQNKMKKTFYEQEHIRFYKDYVYSDSSIDLLNQNPLLLFGKDDFSKIFRNFCKSMKKFGYPQNEDIEMITQFLNIFSFKKKILLFLLIL